MRHFINIVAATRDCCPLWISLYIFCMTIKLLLLLQFQTHTPTNDTPILHHFLHKLPGCFWASLWVRINTNRVDISGKNSTSSVVCWRTRLSLTWRVDEFLPCGWGPNIKSSFFFFSSYFYILHSRCCAFRKKKQKKKKSRIKVRASFNLRIPPSSSSSSRLCVFACALMEWQLHVGRPHEGNVVAEYWSERLLHHPWTSLTNRGLFIHSRLKEKIPHLISNEFSVRHC